MSKNREKKETVVAELKEKVGKAKAIVFSNYQGMTHQQLEELKKTLKKANAEMLVAKNTLMHIALKENNIDTQDKQLEKATATMFAYDDVVTPLKEITKSFKTLKLPEIKFGIFEGSLLADTEVVRLSTLPSREQLIAQVVGGIKSPLFGLHRALNWNLQKLVLTLNAIQTKKASS